MGMWEGPHFRGGNQQFLHCLKQPLPLPPFHQGLWENQGWASVLLAGYHCFSVLFMTPRNMGTFPKLTWLTLEFYSPGQKSGYSLGSPICAVTVSYNRSPVLPKFRPPASSQCEQFFQLPVASHPPSSGLPG